MATKINREANGNINLTLIISWSKISSEFTKVLEKAISEATLPGFRPGKAPRELVEPKLDKTKLYSQAVESLLPIAYSEALKEHDLKPILSPHVHLVSGEENKDWEFTATTCELPEAKLPENYDTELKKLEFKDEDKLHSIITWLRDNSEVQVPDALVEEESNHRLSSLVENVTRLGMSVDSYLESKKTTSDQLKAQSATEARQDLATEFVLEEIRKSKDLKTRKETLDFLLSLV